MLKNEREKFFLSMAVVLTIAGFLAWQVININADIDNNINKLKDKKISEEVYSLKEKSLEQELEAYNFSKGKIEKINNYFVYASDNDDAELAYFFGQLDDIAMQSTKKEKSLVIDLYQSRLSAAKDGKKAVVSKDSFPQASGKEEDSRLLRLTLKSNFEGLLKFISYLEAMPYYIHIESADINIDSGAGSEKNLDKNILSTSGSVNLQSVLIIKVFRKTNIL